MSEFCLVEIAAVRSWHRKGRHSRRPDPLSGYCPPAGFQESEHSSQAWLAAGRCVANAILRDSRLRLTKGLVAFLSLRSLFGSPIPGPAAGRPMLSERWPHRIRTAPRPPSTRRLLPALCPSVDSPSRYALPNSVLTINKAYINGVHKQGYAALWHPCPEGAAYCHRLGECATFLGLRPRTRQLPGSARRSRCPWP